MNLVSFFLISKFQDLKYLELDTIQRQYPVLPLALENLGAPDMMWSLWMSSANLNMSNNLLSVRRSTLIFMSSFLQMALLC